MASHRKIRTGVPLRMAPVSTALSVGMEDLAHLQHSEDRLLPQQRRRDEDWQGQGAEGALVTAQRGSSGRQKSTRTRMSKRRRGHGGWYRRPLSPSFQVIDWTEQQRAMGCGTRMYIKGTGVMFPGGRGHRPHKVLVLLQRCSYQGTQRSMAPRTEPRTDPQTVDC